MIEKIIGRNKAYYIDCKSIGFYYDKYKDNFCYFENFPGVKHGDRFVLRLEKNDGHLFLYNDETNKLIVELMPVSKAWIKKLQNYFKTGINDFSIEDESLLPSQTDASTTEYIEPSKSENSNEEAESTFDMERAKSAKGFAIPKPAPDVGKTAVVTENLRLRTDNKTTAEVVTTLVAGTHVKVLAPGREDTIDGIMANRVQVEVQDDAKDKDGNAIEAGTTGWLFGGYLSEAESAESESPNEEASAAKQGSRLPIVPIAAGGAALAFLLAVVLLAGRKRKADNR